MKTPCLFGYSRHRAARGPIRFRVHLFSCSFTDSSSRTNTCKKRVNRLPPSVIYRGSRKIKKKSGPPARRLIFRRRLHPCTCGPSSPSSARDVLPPCSARATSRSSRCAAHEQARASSIPRGLRPGAQEDVRRARAEARGERQGAEHTLIVIIRRGVFVGRCVRDADVPRRDGAAPPGTGATTTTRSRVSFCRLVCRFNEGAGGGLTAPDPLFPHVNMRSHSVHVRSCSFTGVWAHAVCFHEYLCS